MRAGRVAYEKMREMTGEGEPWEQLSEYERSLWHLAAGSAILEWATAMEKAGAAHGVVRLVPFVNVAQPLRC
jgi:hypothetical protein